MHRRFLVGYSAFWLSVLAYAIVLVRNPSAAPARPEVATAARDPRHEEARLRALADYRSQTQVQLNGLASLEAKRVLRGEATRHMYEARSRLQFARSAIWSSVLTTNWHTFEWLRHQAHESPASEIHCTICDGRGALGYCLLCENSGKCPGCQGKGKGYHGEICPTCLGVGKCYLCAGSGRMTCLYCEEGTISGNQPLPPLSLPVRCDPAPAAPEIARAKSKVADLESAPANERQKRAGEPQVAAPPPPSSPAFGLVLSVGLLLGAAFAIRKMVGLRRERFRPEAPAPAPVAAENLPAGIRAEDKDFSEFVTTFQAGPPALAPTATVAAPAPTAADTSAEFHARAARLLRIQRKLLEDIARETDQAARQRMLADLRREMCALKGEADRPEVLLVWQVAFALEGLLKQLTDKEGNVTASTLRTVAGGVDLLDDLCLPGLRPDLLTAQPLQFLAVDDDLISRKALALALKKALNQPDLAEDGATAVALATRHAYDVIFLDVQMPGMDGFELCTKIHETVTNATTPVVFVTGQSDFDAHSRSTLSGGSDLLGKPFLTFEVTVKALTLALRGRLQKRDRTAAADGRSNGATVPSPARAETSYKLAAKVALPETATDSARSSQSVANGRSPAEPGPATPAPVEADVIRASNLLPDEVASRFLTRAAAHLAPLQDLFQSVFQTADEAARQDMLADVYLGIHALNSEPNFATLHPALQMSAALQGLLRKLLENPKQATASTLVTVAAGVDLLQDLCAAGLKSDLITNPPIRMLVVDDDPLSRRAVVCALQMAFEKPEAAESGAAALALAADRPFDLIFLDVQMPGMDGFTTCTKLHETVLNGATPVVFVTGQSDFQARTQMSRSGGSDFVGKPFLISEITVKALTFALRGRLDKMEPVPA